MSETSKRTYRLTERAQSRVRKVAGRYSVAGLQDAVVDLSVSPETASVACPYSVDGNGSVWLADPGSPDTMLSILAGNHDRYVLLDRGDGNTLMIAIEAGDAGGWATNLAEAMTIVQSFEFTH